MLLGVLPWLTDTCVLLPMASGGSPTRLLHRQGLEPSYVGKTRCRTGKLPVRGVPRFWQTLTWAPNEKAAAGVHVGTSALSQEGPAP